MRMLHAKEKGKAGRRTVKTHTPDVTGLSSLEITAIN